jgi:GWxTD domain-containing protein
MRGLDVEGNKIFILLVLALCFFAPGLQSEKNTLPAQYKKWLDEEVVYIISPMEKEVFLKLQTDKERDRFIEAFWKQRDPTPGTPENEFKTEHYRRINYANRYYGRETPIPGWKTDRGRMYIILGEPNDIQGFEGKSETYPAEIWFYQGKTDLGLPPGFNLVFFKEGGSGEYKLYSPARDGPQALLTNSFGPSMDYLKAYEQLRDAEPSLAAASLSLVPGEESAGLGRPSLASDLLIQRIEILPTKQIKDKYAQKFLLYKDVVEVEYSANYIDNDSFVKVFKDASGIYFVHYAIELQRLSVNQYEKKYYTTFKLNGTISNQEGKTVYQFEKTIPINFDEERMTAISHQPFDIYDLFPLIPGNYKFSVLVKNEISKEFTSLERNLVIPGEEVPLQLGSLVLGYNVKKIEGTERKLKPFQVGEYQIYSQPNRVFVKSDTLAVVFQIYGLNEILKQEGEIRFVFAREGTEFRSLSKKISEYPNLPNFLEKFSLADFPPAHYNLQVSLIASGKEVLSQGDEFDVTFQEAMPRPWIYLKVMPAAGDSSFDYLLGIQYFNSGKMDEARRSFEKACQKKPESAEFAVGLAQVYLNQADYQKLKALLVPFFNQAQPASYEMHFIMGKTYQNSEEFDKAIEVFDKAISHYGVNVNLLNAIGECYFKLGNAEGALAAWEKSLEISPDQTQIKKSVEALKEKK